MRSQVYAAVWLSLAAAYLLTVIVATIGWSQGSRVGVNVSFTPAGPRIE